MDLVFQDARWEEASEELIKLSLCWRESDLDNIDVSRALENWRKAVEYIKDNQNYLNLHWLPELKAIAFFSSQLATLNSPMSFFWAMRTSLKAIRPSAEEYFVELVEELESFESTRRPKQFPLIGLLSHSCSLEFMDSAFETNLNSFSTKIDFSKEELDQSTSNFYNGVSFDHVQVDLSNLKQDSTLNLSGSRDFLSDLTFGFVPESVTVLGDFS